MDLSNTNGDMMELFATIMVVLVALEHVYILVLEMFMWNRAVKAFGVPRDMRDNDFLKSALKNQGLYNGFLAAGLFWGLLHPDPAMGWQIQIFFVGCVVVAGVYGAATADKKILFIQALPAAIAGTALLM